MYLAKLGTLYYKGIQKDGSTTTYIFTKNVGFAYIFNSVTDNLEFVEELKSPRLNIITLDMVLNH